MGNTIIIPVTMVGVFAELVAALQLNGVRYKVETTVNDFIITATGA